MPSARTGFEEVLAEEDSVVAVRNHPVGPVAPDTFDAEEPAHRPAEAPAAGPVREVSARRVASAPVLNTESAQGTRTTQQIAAQPEPATPPRQRLELNARTRGESPAIRPPMRSARSVVTGAAPPPVSSSVPESTDRMARPPLVASAPQPTDRPADEQSARKFSARGEHPTPAVRSQVVQRSSEPAVVLSSFTRASARPGVGRAVAIAKAVQPKLPAVPAVQAPTASRSVEITIGRIDVRTPPIPQSRQQPAAKPAVPKLSLEEYLRDRSTGAR